MVYHVKDAQCLGFIRLVVGGMRGQEGGGGTVELNCSAPTRCQRFLMLGRYQCFFVDANVSVSWQPTAELHSRGQDNLKPVVNILQYH